MQKKRMQSTNAREHSTLYFLGVPAGTEVERKAKKGKEGDEWETRIYCEGKLEVKKQDGREEERRETVQFLWPAWVSVSESGYEGGRATPTSSDRIKQT